MTNRAENNKHHCVSKLHDLISVVVLSGGVGSSDAIWSQQQAVYNRPFGESRPSVGPPGKHVRSLPDYLLGRNMCMATHMENSSVHT